MKSRITISFFLIFLLLVAASAHAEDIFEPDYATYNTSLYSETTDIVNSDIVVRVGGNFNSILSYPVSEVYDQKFNYIGAGGNISLYYCSSAVCGIIDQNLATIYTYKGSGNHFLGATHAGFIYRFLRGNRFLLEWGIGTGAVYASNSEDIEKKVFKGAYGVAVSLKLYLNSTIFINSDFGIGLSIAPSALYELGRTDVTDANSIFYSFDAGIHLMYKY